MYKTQLLRLLFFCACLLGCIYQVSHITRQYFAYETTTRVVSNTDYIIRYPSIILCSKISDFVHDSRLTNNSLTTTQQLHDLTIRQLHQLTPAANRSIISCYLRIDKQKFSYKGYTSDICHQYFNVRKSIIGHNVCYQFNARSDLKYSIHDVANAFNYSYVVYSVILKQEFTRMTRLYMPAHYTDHFFPELGEVVFPVNSRKFGEPLIHYRYQESLLINRPSEEVFKLLPAPYDTECVNNNGQCYPHCMINKTISLMKRFPYTEAATEYFSRKAISSEIKILSERDLRDAGNVSKWKNILQSCSHQCNKKPCRMSVTSNNVFASHNSIEFLPVQVVPLGFSVGVPSSYGKEITTLSYMSWIEYISGLTNCLSIWFGISVVAINPLKYIVRQENKIPHYCTLLKRYGLLIYYIICVSGFLYQSGEICRDYFKFKTSATIEVSTVDDYEYQRLGICLEYHHILNRTNHTKYGLFSKPPNAFHQFERYQSEYSLLTVEEIFSLTPSTEEIISRCGIRREPNIGFDFVDSKTCLELFSIEKAVRGTKLCYFFTPRKQTYSWIKVASSYNDTGQVYEIKTSLQLNNSLLATFITDNLHEEVRESSKLPSESRMFAHEVMIYPENVVTVASMTNAFFRLPPPYDTKCREAFIYQDCVSFCVNKVLEIIDRKPYFAFLNFPFKQKVLNFLDVRNESISSLAVNAFKSCSKKCHGFPCQTSISFTTADVYHRKQLTNLVLISLPPKAPTINVYYVPSTYPLNFFIYISNCFGIWFGLSIVSINPSVVYQKGKGLLNHDHGKTIITRHKKMKKRLFLKAFVLICLAGFIWQGSLVSMTYFSYRTYSRIQVSTKDNFTLSTLNICLRYKDIIGNQSVNLLNLTVQDIFEMTPTENNSLTGCWTRDSNSDVMMLRDKDSCVTNFQNAKYVFGSTVCYVYRPSTSYSLTRITSSPSKSAITYKLLLSPVFNSATFFSFYWFTLSTWRTGRPSQSRKHNSITFRDAVDDDSENYYFVQGINHNITLLPKPYDTQCLLGNSSVVCFSSCYMNYVSTILKRVPFDEITTDPIPFRIMSKDDMSNSTFRELVVVGNQKCRSLCLQHECNQYYSMTTATGYWKSRPEHDGMTIAVGTPSSNDLIVTTYPAFTLIDFLNNLAVSGSIWLGVSVMSIAMYIAKLFKQNQQQKLKPRSPNERFRVFNQQFKVTARFKNQAQ